jgi:hypothetical protein
MSTNNAPGQVFIIRHGEKLGDPKKDDDGGRHLSIKGSARAAALPGLFVAAQPQLSCGEVIFVQKRFAAHCHKPLEVRNSQSKLAQEFRLKRNGSAQDSREMIAVSRQLKRTFLIVNQTGSRSENEFSTAKNQLS